MGDALLAGRGVSRFQRGFYCVQDVVRVGSWQTVGRRVEHFGAANRGKGRPSGRRGCAEDGRVLSSPEMYFAFDVPQAAKRRSKQGYPPLWKNGLRRVRSLAPASRKLRWPGSAGVACAVENGKGIFAARHTAVIDQASSQASTQRSRCACSMARRIPGRSACSRTY